MFVASINKMRRRRSKIGGLDTKTVILAIGAGVVGYVLYSNTKDLSLKIFVDTVSINSFSGGKLNLTVTIKNLSGFTANLDGFNGTLYLTLDSGTASIGTVTIDKQSPIPAHGSVSLPVAVSPDYGSVISIGEDAWNIITGETDFSTLKISLKGNIFSGAITIPVDRQFF